MYDGRADFDELVWDANDAAMEASLKLVRRVSAVRKMEGLATRRLGRAARWVAPLVIGGYHCLYRMRVVDGSDRDVMVRLPLADLVQFPAEKTRAEVATAAFVAQNTGVPVPRVLAHGLDDDDDGGGPFMIVEYVEHSGCMSHALAMPDDDPAESHMLDPGMPDDVLEQFYSKAAVHLLQLVEPTFPRIGSLAQVGENAFSVAGRPVTQNMNSMVRLADIPRAVLPPEDRTYATADEWYVALADMHMAQLVFQQNDLVKSADDCRNKYVARQLFRKLARHGRLSTFGFAEDQWSAQSRADGAPSTPSCSAPDGSGSFRLWCDDLRPGNILLDKCDDVAAVVDWEFAYAAPTQFALDPPWWLLLEAPETWRHGMDDWAAVYEARLQTWLRAMERAEQSSGGGLQPPPPPPPRLHPNAHHPLSACMRRSWATGRFWLDYAARKSWAFDAVFWRHLDERFFGSREEVVVVGGIKPQQLWETRMHLLSEVERVAMHELVRTKMEESKRRTLRDWDDDAVRERWADVAFVDEMDWGQERATGNIKSLATGSTA